VDKTLRITAVLFAALGIGFSAFRYLETGAAQLGWFTAALLCIFIVLAMFVVGPPKKRLRT
jgi:hypothetical protein